MPAFDPPPQFFGLPSREKLRQYEIWDAYFTPAFGADGGRIAAEMERTAPTLEKGAIRRLCVFLNVGLGNADPRTEARIRAEPESVVMPLKRWPERLLGLIQLNPSDVEGSLGALNRWLRDGPMVGVYFASGRRGSLPCTHRNFEPLVKRIAELNGLIVQHTWFKTGGKGSPGESTPAELAHLAARFPETPFVCAHAGGEWEKGIRAIRGVANVYAETSGFDPTAGFIEMAVRELGPERIVFGSHLPSRSLGTELGKVLGADISERDRRQILGANLRRLLGPILRNKGLERHP